jgi:hypothetical protein
MVQVRNQLLTVRPLLFLPCKLFHLYLKFSMALNIIDLANDTPFTAQEWICAERK